MEQKQQRFPALCVFGKPRTLFVRSFGKRKLTFSWCHSRASALSVCCLFTLVNPALLRHPGVTAGETEHKGNKSSVATEKGRRRCSSFSPHACSAGTYPEGSFLRHRHCSSAQNTNKMPISRRWLSGVIPSLAWVSPQTLAGGMEVSTSTRLEWQLWLEGDGGQVSHHTSVRGSLPMF